MQFFIDSQGTVTNLISSPVYQGSTNASELVLVAPLSASNVVTAVFKLPNGLTTTPRLMTVQGQPMVIDGNVKSCGSNGMSAYAAQILAQFVGLLTRTFSVAAARPSRLLRFSPNDLLSQKGRELRTYSTSDQIRRVPDSHRVPLFSRTRMRVHGYFSGSRICHKISRIYGSPPNGGGSCSPMPPPFPKEAAPGQSTAGRGNHRQFS